MLKTDVFRSQFHALSPNFENQRFLLAVSGGADSMVLAALFNRLQLNFGIAHVNYKLRAEDSDADQLLVEKFAQENAIPLYIYEVSPQDNPPKHSVQLWARNLRYAFFQKIQNEENWPVLVTAHHLNDQLETFIINLSRGSGLAGLSGIPNDKNLLRPLLSYTKKEIYDFAEKHGVPFREDVSNQKTDYLRNKIRHQVVPELLKINPSFLENFQNSIGFLSETKQFLDRSTDDFLDKICTRKSDGVVLDKAEISNAFPILRFEVLRRFGFKNSVENEKILSATTGAVFYSEKYQLLVNRNELIFKENNLDDSFDNEEILIPDRGSQINLSNFLSVELSSPNHWIFDHDLLHFPLKLRHKKSGDSFFPIGMKGKKKVSKFYKDEKISNFAKPKIFLLVDADDQILGVIPYRQDRRFAEHDKTKNTLKISFQ